MPTCAFDQTSLFLCCRKTVKWLTVSGGVWRISQSSYEGKKSSLNHSNETPKILSDDNSNKDHCKVSELTKNNFNSCPTHKKAGKKINSLVCKKRPLVNG